MYKVIGTTKSRALTGTEESRIALDQIEPNLFCPLQADVLAEVLAPYAQMLRAGAQETLQIAGLHRTSVGRVIYVGGSSIMSMVSNTMKADFPDAQHSFTEVFNAVTDGLAIASGRIQRKTRRMILTQISPLVDENLILGRQSKRL